MTSLMRAAALGHLEAAKLLLTAGARVDEVDSRGETVLFHALRTPLTPDRKLLLRLLTLCGANVNNQNDNGV